MTTIFALFRTSKSLLILCLFVLTLTTQLFSQSIVGPPVAFVSTFSSNSIDAVDASGNVSTLNSVVSVPEGIAIGPDGFIYICEPDANAIVRTSQDGTVTQTVFSGNLTPEGPSFSPSGDLYFNTKVHTGVYKISSTALSSLPEGGATPTLVENSDGITLGEGTGFDINHNLLIVDRNGSKVLRFLLSSNTFDSAHTISVGVNAPIGVAVNSGGDIFVANSGTQSVLRFANDGTAKGTYVTFPTATDLPFYLQFDSNDNLYVITADSNGLSGQLWKIPPSSTTATLPSSPLASFTSATGVAVVETGVSEIQPLSPTSPTQFFNGFPFQFAADYSQAVSAYGISVNGIDMIVDAQQITKADWITRSTSAGSTFGAAGSSCIQHTGAGSNCLCYVAKCFPHGGDPSTATGTQCPTSPASDLFFTDTFTTCDPTPPTNTNASFFTANEDPTVNDFQDILIPNGVSGSFTPPSGSCTADPITGGSRGTNSIFCVAEDAPISITITTPTGTNYTLNQAVTANYQCSTPPGPASSCAGPVPSGNNIDTSTVGSHDFTVNAANGLNTASKTVTYTVGFGTGGACLLYDPTKMVKSGAVFPLKLYLCDAAGHDVSSSTIVLTAIRVKLVSTGTSDTSLLSPGNSQADNNFRFDSTLGPSGGYIFNFDTSGKHGTYNLFFTATGDPNLHSITFQVR